MMLRQTASRSRLVLAGLLALSMLLSAHPGPLSAASTESFDPRFGAVEAFRESDRADEAGVRWTRIVFWWSGLQPNDAKGWNQFYFPDDLLQAELSSGRRVVGLLMNTPAWAGDGSTQSPPRGLDRPLNDPENLSATFSRQIAERYRGRIDNWVGLE